MTGGRRLPATRIELLKARRELARVQHGAALVRRKREALVAELFRAARPAMDLREELARAATEAAEELLDALASQGHAALAVIARPERPVLLTLEPGMVWGIAVSNVIDPPTLVRSLEARGTSPALTGQAAAGAALRFERLTELLVRAAPGEQRVRRLGEAVSRSTRLMRTLEQRVAPDLARRIASVRRHLDEREREDRLRLKHLARAGRG